MPQLTGINGITMRHVACIRYHTKCETFCAELRSCQIQSNASMGIADQNCCCCNQIVIPAGGCVAVPALVCRYHTRWPASTFWQVDLRLYMMSGARARRRPPIRCCGWASRIIAMRFSEVGCFIARSATVCYYASHHSSKKRPEICGAYLAGQQLLPCPAAALQRAASIEVHFASRPSRQIDPMMEHG